MLSEEEEEAAASSAQSSEQALTEKIAAGLMLSEEELEELRVASMESATAKSDELAAKLAEGHMLTADELEELRATSMASATAKSDLLAAKLAQGHMLTADELEELRTSSMESATAKSDALAAKLAQGHMLTGDELEELRATSLASATAKSDELAAKLAQGHMLTADEIAELKTCVTTVEAALVEALSAKLAQGHMLSATELKQLRAANRGPPTGKTRAAPPHRSAGRREKSTGSAQPLMERLTSPPRLRPPGGGRGWYNLNEIPSTGGGRQWRDGPSAVPMQHENDLAAFSLAHCVEAAEKLYHQGDVERRRRQEHFRRPRAQSAHPSKSPRAQSARVCPPSTTEKLTQKVQDGQLLSPQEMNELRQAQENTEGHQAPRRNAPSSARGLAHATDHFGLGARAPTVPRSARPTRPTPRIFSATPATSNMDSALMQKVASGQLLSPDELTKLRFLSDPDVAKAILKRVEEGHVLEPEEVSILQQAQRAAHAADSHRPELVNAMRPNSSRAALERPRSRGALPSIASIGQLEDGAASSAGNGRKQKQALAQLKINAMELLADGVDIGDMKLADLLDLKPTSLKPLQMGERVSSGRRGSPNRGHYGLQRRSREQLGLAKSYGIR